MAAHFGDVVMPLNLGNPGFYDESVIDHRNERPLTIALATIVLMWTLTFGIASVSAHLAAQACHFAHGSAAMISPVVK
jgi:hypothetical protein